MENLKIKVNSVEESNQAQDLLIILGYRKGLCEDCAEYVITANRDADWHSSGAQERYWNLENCRLVTIPELKDMVVLHRNDVKDATHRDINNDLVYRKLLGEWYFFSNSRSRWVESKNEDLYNSENIKEINMSMQKEYLQKLTDGTYKLVVLDSVVDGHEGLIGVPEGADFYVSLRAAVRFVKNVDGKWMGFCDSWVEFISSKYNPTINNKILWQRHTQPEELPFFDDECLLDKVCKYVDDQVNHPSHYTNGKTECIDALESATVGKSGIEAVCTANIIKYLWRYEDKNGLEDVKKAQWYLNKLISHLESK